MSEPHDTREAGRAGWSYCGEAWTDRRGRATVAVPPATRRSREAFSYELTAAEADVTVELVRELRDGRFVLATDRPHAKVAWRLTEVGHQAEPDFTNPGGAS